MNLKSFWLLALILLSVPAFGQEAPWSAGVEGRYSIMGKVNAVEIGNGPSIAAHIRHQFSPKVALKLEYQWIESEHIGGDSSEFHTLRLVPQFLFLVRDTYSIGAELGVGYQYADLSNIDQIGMFELSFGPVARLEIKGPWSLLASAHYANSFDEFIKSGLQRLDFGLGISYQFGWARDPNSEPFVDSDQDGVADNEDQCNSTPFGIKVAKNGCPADTDFDLVADYNDFCPDTKRGDEVDDIGCSLYTLGRGVIDGIAFEKNSPRLTANSRSELSKVAEQLKKYPNLFYVVEGYSSSGSSEEERLSISKARAVSVMNILISYGVPTHKIKAEGLSGQYPLTDSKNEADKSLNERIEIKWKNQF